MGRLDYWREIAERTGFRMDEQAMLLQGQRGAFPLTVGQAGNVLEIHAAASRYGAPPDKKELRQGCKECKAVSRCEVKGNHVVFYARAGMTRAKVIDYLTEALDFVPVVLQRTGCVPCCEHCGQSIETRPYVIKGRPAHLCEACFAKVSTQLSAAQTTEEEKRENIVGGIVGAFLGSLVGGLAIVLIAQLGYIAWISGMIMGVCTLYSYKLLGGKLTTKGIVISVIVMAGMVYLANRIGYAIQLNRAVGREFGAAAGNFGFFDAFQIMPEMAREEAEIGRAYYGDLVKTYLFTALGAVPTIITMIKNRKVAYTAERS